MRLVGMLIPEKALSELLAELQSSEQGPQPEQRTDPGPPVGRSQDGPAKGSLRDIR